MRVNRTIRPDFKKCIETYDWDITIINGMSDRLNQVYDLKFQDLDKAESWLETEHRDRRNREKITEKIIKVFNWTVKLTYKGEKLLSLDAN